MGKKDNKKVDDEAVKNAVVQSQSQDFVQKIAKNHITINKIMFQNLLST